MPKTKVSFYIENEDLEHIKRLAGKIEDGSTKSVGKILRRLIKMGLDDALALEKIGAVDIVMSAGKVINVLKKKFLSEKKTVSLNEFK